MPRRLHLQRNICRRPPDRLAVIDGDTLRIGDDVVHLAGITAPARDTLCRSPAGAEQDCGVAAANALAALVRKGPIECAIQGHDPRGRPVADCQSGGVSLSEAQVRDGWARAQTAALKQTEAAAQRRQAGASGATVGTPDAARFAFASDPAVYSLGRLDTRETPR